MGLSNKVILKKKRGRPATGNDPVRAIRLSDEFLAKVDTWARKQDDQPGRSEAIRRLVEIGLKSKAEVSPAVKPGRRAPPPPDVRAAADRAVARRKP